MKFFNKLLLIILAGYFTSCSHLKQINYREKYQACLQDYQSMYKMMENKIKFYVDNEKTLMDTVESTIVKTYEKSESSNIIYQSKLSELENTIKELKVKLKNKEDQFKELKSSYEKQITKLEINSSHKEKELETISTDDKVLKEDYSKLKTLYNDVIKQSDSCKLNLQKKQFECDTKLYECYSKINTIISKPEIKETNQKENSILEKNMKTQDISLDYNKIDNVVKKINIDLEGGIINERKIGDSLNLVFELIENLTLSNGKLGNNFTFPKEIDNNYTISSDKLLVSYNVTSNLNASSAVLDTDTLLSKEKILSNKLLNETLVNINKTQVIYESLLRVSSEIKQFILTKTKCEGELNTLLSQNIELKEALAELEVKTRVMISNRQT